MAHEHVYRPEPLSLPADDEPPTIAASAAVALFAARARAASRHFVLDAGSGPVVADICRRLDGIPLAIELAASRVPLLGLGPLRDMLEQRLDVLTAGDRTALRRHRTLREALDWSHGLLSVAEQAVLRRLAVFVGGFTLEAAQQVAEDDTAIDRWDVLEHLGTLVDKSLVVAEGDPLPRYRLLETTRLFALEQLLASGEADAVRERHRDHFLAIAEQARRAFIGDRLPAALAQLDQERENLFLALAWAPEGADPQPALRLVNALRYYWPARGLPARGLQATLAALARPATGPADAARCTALAAASQLALWCGDLAQARQHADAALQLAHQLGRPALIGHALGVSASLHLRHGDDASACQQALEAIAMGAGGGDSTDLAQALMLRAHADGRRGDLAGARLGFTQALAMLQRLDDRHGMAGAHLGLAILATGHQRPAEAPAHLLQVLQLLPSVPSRTLGTLLVGATAAWAAAAGRLAGAARLEAAFRQLCRRSALGGQPPDRHVEDIDALRRRLGDDAWAREWAAGEALDLQAALAVAHEQLQAPAGAGAPR